MRESWTDERLDHLNATIDQRFEQVEQRFDQVDKRFDQVDKRFDQVDKRFERIESDIREMRSEMTEGFKSMQRMMFHGVIALSASIVAGFGGMTGLLAVAA